MQCQDAQQLVPSYLDDELSAAQAGPLRSHLLDCPSCRGVVQELKSLRRWFEPAAAPAVPADFAARVARRAFAGDTGDRAPLAPAALTASGAVALSDERRSYGFAMYLTAAAALVLCVLTIALRSQELPGGGTMRADELPSVDALVQELEDMNQGTSVPTDVEAEGDEATSSESPR